MFKKILIANRGEIACRVIKTARRMGIATVAVYSEADRDALHVAMADEAVAIGPPPAAQSYLDIERIVAACKETGAEAVHPGYGFLSERAAFAEALDEAGITFIGPNAKAIDAMGDKITSKKLAAEAGVSTVPGHLGVIVDTDEAIRIARRDRLSGDDQGVGRRRRQGHAHRLQGRRRWPRASSARARRRSPRSATTASSSKKFIEDPRHIEIQVLGDKHGHCIYLGERECSIQRRNQKVVEEAPSPLLDEATTQEDGRAGRRAGPRPSATIRPEPSSSSRARTRASSSSR